MSRSPTTFAKRQREMEKKQRAQAKRVKREQRKQDPPAGEEPTQHCVPYV
jgi:hypothetical protein